MNDYYEYVESLEEKNKRERLQTQVDPDLGGKSIESVFVPDIFEVIMLSLRTKQGIDCLKIRAVYGNEILEKILTSLKSYVEQNYVEIEFSDNEDEILRINLSDPDGYLISNDIISSVFAALS